MFISVLIQPPVVSVSNGLGAYWTVFCFTRFDKPVSLFSITRSFFFECSALKYLLNYSRSALTSFIDTLLSFNFFSLFSKAMNVLLLLVTSVEPLREEPESLPTRVVDRSR